METNVIIPTKTNPVFTASSDYFGNIETSFYKRALVEITETTKTSIPVFAIKYTEAISLLHEWLIERGKEELLQDGKSIYTIYMVDGTIDKKWDEVKHLPVYKISAKKAIKYLF